MWWLFLTIKTVSAVRRDLEMFGFYHFSPKWPEREKNLKHYVKTLQSPLKRAMNSYISLFYTSSWISWKRQANGMIQPFQLSRSFLKNIQTFTISKLKLVSHNPHVSLCFVQIYNFFLVRNFCKSFKEWAILSYFILLFFKFWILSVCSDLEILHCPALNISMHWGWSLLSCACFPAPTTLWYQRQESRTK